LLRRRVCGTPESRMSCSVALWSAASSIALSGAPKTLV
jgi:hypothetical protein